MKELNVESFESLNGVRIDEAARILKNVATWEYVDMLNWPVAFPYKPQTKFKVARSEDKLYIRFEVIEKNIKALYLNDQDPVWKDSCVEFFCKIPGSERYFNFEFNCIGTCLASSRVGRNESVDFLPSSKMQRIERYASLPRKIRNGDEGEISWDLSIAIPFDLIGVFTSRQIYANFYKCGDDTLEPHYLSWNLIHTNQPDFHRTEFFGLLNLL